MSASTWTTSQESIRLENLFDSSECRTRKKAAVFPSLLMYEIPLQSILNAYFTLGLEIVLFFSFTEIPSGGLNFAWMNSNYHKTSTSQLMNIQSSPHVQKQPNKDDNIKKWPLTGMVINSKEMSVPMNLRYEVYLIFKRLFNKV